MEQNYVTVTVSILHGRSSPCCRSVTGGRRPRSPGSRVFPASRCVGRKSRTSESRAVRCALRPAATGSRDHGNTRRRLATERRSTSFTLEIGPLVFSIRTYKSSSSSSSSSSILSAISSNTYACNIKEKYFKNCTTPVRDVTRSDQPFQKLIYSIRQLSITLQCLTRLYVFLLCVCVCMWTQSSLWLPEINVVLIKQL